MSEIETNYEHAMRTLLAHSVTCFAARRNPGEDYTRAVSESHLAGTVAYVLEALHDSDQGAADDVAVRLNEWASDGEELNGWVARHAAFLGLDVDALITEAQKPMPDPVEARCCDDIATHNHGNQTYQNGRPVELRFTFAWRKPRATLVYPAVWRRFAIRRNRYGATVIGVVIQAGGTALSVLWGKAIPYYVETQPEATP